MGTLAEHAKEVIQLRVVEDEIEGVVVELEHAFERRVIVGIDKGQVPGIEKSHHVLWSALIHRYTAVPRVVNFPHLVIVQHCVYVDAVDVSELGHHIFGLLLLEGQDTRDDLHLVLLNVVVLLRDVEQLEQLVPLVDRAHFFPQHEVEDEAQREGHREGEDHEEVGDPYGGGAYQETVAGTHRLGHDLPKDHDAYGCHGDSNRPRHDVVQEDGDGAVHGDVAKQNGAEEIVPVPAHAVYQPGAQLLSLRAALHNYLESGGVKGHQAEVEAGEKGGEAEKD